MKWCMGSGIRNHRLHLGFHTLLYLLDNQGKPSVSLDTVFSTRALLGHRGTFEEDCLRPMLSYSS